MSKEDTVEEYIRNSRVHPGTKWLEVARAYANVGGDHPAAVGLFIHSDMQHKAMSARVHPGTKWLEVARAYANVGGDHPAAVGLFIHSDMQHKAMSTYWSPADARKIAAQLVAAADQAEAHDNSKETVR